MCGLAAMTAFGTIPVGAQPQTRYRVGTLLATPPSAEELSIRHFKRGMQELGYVEGDNIEYFHR